MIAEILPDTVCAVEAREDPVDVVLFAEEEAVLGQAVDKRRREFTTARHCAHQALARLGLPAQSIPSGPRGEPRWPEGVVGSITHCHGYRACALAHASELLAIGIDAEPNEPLPDGVLAAIATAQELPMLGQLTRARPEVHWDRLLFSAKESVYKVWYPLAERPLGFEDAVLELVLDSDPHKGAFSARLLIAGPSLDGVPFLGFFSGRWLVREGLIFTTIAVVHRELSKSLP